MAIPVTLIPGDGIGPEVVNAAVRGTRLGRYPEKELAYRAR